ncbi:RHS repeat-associated core domain-containing protein, partial [Viscerimonas tarda]
MFGLGLYDFEARQLDGYGGFTSMDPLAEKYYSISPYAYCANNPLKYVDPDGREVYYAQDGTRLGQLGDNEDIRVLNANLSNKDAMAHIASGSEDAISAMMDGSVAFADYFTNVSDVTNGAALVLYAGNCYDAATTQMENEGYSPLSPTSAIHTKVNTVLDSDIQENTIGGAIKIQTDLNAGKPVMVGVEQSDGKGNVGYEKGNYNQSTSHFVVIRSSNVDKNGTITFNYLDNGTLLGKSRNNNMTLNTSTGMISGRMEQRKATYTVSEVRKSRTIRK